METPDRPPAAAEGRKIALLAVALIVLGGLLPPAAHRAVFGRARDVTPGEARDLLARPGSDAVLVDVRPRMDYEAGHVEGAASWPYDDIAVLASPAGVPERLQGKRLLLICDSGLLSALAAERLEEKGVARVLNVAGGRQEWTATVGKPCPIAFLRPGARPAEPEPEPAGFRESTLLEQWAAVGSGFWVKPVYTVLSLLLIVVLWRSRAADLAALRWAMVFFFVGENFCAANYLIYGDRSRLLEYLHSYGMVVCFGLTAWAVLEGFDRRVLKLSEPGARCAALALCHGCSKVAPGVSCGLRRVFLFLIPALAVLALAPFTGRAWTVSYNTRILGTAYNYSHPGVHQVYEIMVCPALALALLAASFAVLRWKRIEPIAWSKALFAAAIGPLGFGYLRWWLIGSYKEDMAWFGFWEEVTEFLFVSGAAFVLWTFRASLFPRRPAAGEAGPERPSAPAGAGS